MSLEYGGIPTLAAQGQAAGQQGRDGDLYYDRFAKSSLSGNGSAPNLNRGNNGVNNATGAYMG